MIAAHHPLLDGAGPGWQATETRADVVALTVGMSDFLRGVVTAGDRPIVVSGEYSRMTQPLAEALNAVDGHWVIRTAEAGCYDARTGASLSAPEAILTLGRLTAETALHPAFTRAALVARLQAVVTVSTRHRVSRPVRLGGALEAASEIYTDAVPTGWGATEPLVAAWDRDDLTARTRARMPDDSRWAAVTAGKHPLVGTIAVARTAEGLEETTRVWAEIGGPGDDRAAEVGGASRELLARAAAIGMPLLGVAFAALGTSDLTRRSTETAPPEPLALLIGPPGVRALGVDAAPWAAATGGAVVGSPRLPGVLIALGSVEGGGWQRLSEVLRALEPDRVAHLLSIAPQLATDLRRHESEG